ncbi:DMT family transporter [Lentilactobacillus parafarraginis]|uniref:Membrane protein n=1 Tax=Lentilactobacillus parafarraginis DSM 18390 = JCM 14109 TaxID=1423786 RepID=A0A0R1YY51_9LACO|nr:membrane protein [Lentilactobacillus parafarraginis DSM 18390 = JCM 14109]
MASNATTSLSIIGYLFLLLGVCSYALYTVFVEKAVDFTGIEATYMMLIAGALVFVTLALTEEKLNHNLTSLITLPMTDTAFLTAVLYQAIGSSVLALFVSNYAIAKVGVNRAASFIGISTVVSIIAGVLFLGEHFGGYQIIGAVIIITGVYLANMIIKI